MLDHDEVIDPVERYQQYGSKYLAGELTPAFESFSVWELRMSITSNARNDELKWAMEMMKIYRPDHVYKQDYAGINDTDVLYLHPEKKFDKLQYHNIIIFWRSLWISCQVWKAGQSNLWNSHVGYVRL